MALVIKNPPTNEGDIRDVGSVPGLGRSLGGGHGNLLQHPCLEIAWAEEPLARLALSLIYSSCLVLLLGHLKTTIWQREADIF